MIVHSILIFWKQWSSNQIRDIAWLNSCLSLKNWQYRNFFRFFLSICNIYRPQHAVSLRDISRTLLLHHLNKAITDCWPYKMSDNFKGSIFFVITTASYRRNYHVIQTKTVNTQDIKSLGSDFTSLTRLPRV